MTTLMNKMLMDGVITREKKGLYTVAAGGELLACHAGSRIRKGGERLLTGDRVELTPNGDGTGFITALLPRKNVLVRPLVANVDAFVAVVAASTPAPYPYNIDKLTAMACYRGIETALVINKCDAAAPDALLAVYERAGCKCFALSAATGEGVSALGAYLRGKTAVLAGASGVGKSSLINALYPETGAEIGALSKKTERGKNTTRHTELFSVGNGTYIADTPGFTMLDEDKLGIESEQSLFECFPEFASYFGKCRFRGCTHLKEDGCAVIAAVKSGDIAASRHDSYVRLYGALKALRKY